jgi:hypothetical protein
LIENGRGLAYVAEVVSGVAAPATVDLSFEIDPDGDRPARPGHPQDKRNANRLSLHNITFRFESTASAKVSVAYPR